MERQLRGLRPRKIDLKLDSVNGGINVSDVRGNLRFQTVNGGITLSGVNGTVKGETVNGGVHVDIAGNRWEGEGLEVETVNGGVVLTVPAAFAANVHAETVNGGMTTNFDGAVVEGKWGPKKMDLRVGGGGPRVSVTTVNGGVQIKKKPDRSTKLKQRGRPWTPASIFVRSAASQAATPGT